MSGLIEDWWRPRKGKKKNYKKQTNECDVKECAAFIAHFSHFLSKFSRTHKQNYSVFYVSRMKKDWKLNKYFL